MASLTIERLNNPGAIEDGPFARSQPGYLGGGGRFARFATPQDGIRAQETLLQKNYRGLNPIQVIDKYAPGKENANARANYIKYVTERAGLDPTKPVPENKIPALASAMREFETGKGKQNVSAADDDFITKTLGNLGIPVRNYSVGSPTAGENANVAKGGNFPVANPSEIPTEKLREKGQKVATTSENYADYLERAIEPLRENALEIVDRQEKITGIKRNITNDFAVREAALEQRIRPLMARKEALLQQLDAVDQMAPLDRRFKAIFNPDKYDPRILRGKLERIDVQLEEYEQNYQQLNRLRSGVAAAAVDAESADVATLNARRGAVAADLELLGQVVGVTRQAAVDQLFPFDLQIKTLTAQEAMKSHFLGTISLEKTTDLYNQALASPDGTVTVDGIKLTVGELQQQTRILQTQDLSFKSAINAFKLGDMQTYDQAESFFINHMSEEQIAEAMKNGGKVTGPNGEEIVLSPAKLAEAAAAARARKAEAVQDVVTGTAVGLAKNVLGDLGNRMKFSGQRLIQMFGDMPAEYTAFVNQSSASIQAWTDGLNAANKQGVGKQYIASTLNQLDAIQKSYDSLVTGIAKRWGGGKADLTSFAEAYFRGSPVSGDVAAKAMITMARSGIPSGARLEGPAAQAFEVAKSVVREFDNPQAGDSLEALIKGSGNQRQKEAALQREVQARVGAIYADSLTELIINDLPKMARGIRDPENPNRLHPFARVSREDFIMSVRHGDAQGLKVVANQMEVNPEVAKAIFQGGVDSAEWKAVASKKGWSNGDFAQFYQALVATQMSETLAALDASHSAAPGFSPSKAYIDFLQRPEVTNRVAQAVNGYGQSSFGAFMVSSASGGGFQDAWSGYTQTLGAVYQQQHSKELQNRIKQQRSLTGDPWVRMNAVVRAAGLTPSESQALLQAAKPLVSLNTMSDSQVLATGQLAGSLMQNRDVGNFDAIASVIRNHKFDDPAIEKLRKKVDSQWDAMDALVGTIFDAVNE